MGKWIEGRQGGGYFKKLLLQGSFFDLYILKFPEGSHIDWHTDPVSGKRHFRVNLFLWKAVKGGEFVCKDPVLYDGRRLQIFRPDINEHMVTTIEKGTRYVLSFGIAIK